MECQGVSCSAAMRRSSCFFPFPCATTSLTCSLCRRSIFPHWGWLAVVGGAFAIGMNKGGLTGLGILPVVLFALVLQARESTGFILPLLIMGDLCAIGVYLRVVIWKVF